MPITKKKYPIDKMKDVKDDKQMKKDSFKKIPLSKKKPKK